MSAPLPRLIAISSRAAQPDGRLEPWLRQVGEAGVESVQLREKDLPDLELFRLAREARRLLPPTTLLLVNGRADIARAAACQGVHLPAAGLPAAPLRSLLGPGFLIGRSTHRLEEIERAREEGADYVTYGPVWATPGKEGRVGTEGLERAAALGVPVFALGGVTIERLPEAAAAGAAGVAGIRIFLEAERLADLVERAARLFNR